MSFLEKPHVHANRGGVRGKEQRKREKRILSMLHPLPPHLPSTEPHTGLELRTLTEIMT